jgi:short-subunit dehydrogenase
MTLTSPIRRALVTGASSGLGREFARLLARDGIHLVLAARRSEALHMVASDIRREHGVEVESVAIDLAEPGAARDLAMQLEQRSLPLDILINNAGAGRLGAFVSQDPADIRRMIGLNIDAVTELTRIVAPRMVARGGGSILNVASTAAFQAGPFMAVYYATKAYVLSFSEAIAVELEKSGVSVTVLCPGPTNTGFQQEAGMHASRNKPSAMSAARVAEIGYRGMVRGKRIVVPGVANKLLVQSNRLVPRRLSGAVIRFLQQSRMRD